MAIKDMRDWLYDASLDITPLFLSGYVSYTAMCNDDQTNLRLGSSCAAKIEFEIQDFNSQIANLTGRELCYEKLVSGATNVYDYALGGVQILNGDYLYYATSASPFIQIYNTQTQTSAPVTSPPPAKAELFVIREGVLYALHAVSPYVTAYAISGQSLTKQPQIATNSYQRELIARYIRAGDCANVTAANVVYNETKKHNGAPQGLVLRSYSRVAMGYFICEQPSKVNNTKHKVVAYDRMAKLDVDVSEWVDGLTYPITIRNLQVQLCAKFGIPFDGTAFVNQDYSVRQNFTGSGITGRQVQQWIAEAAAGFALIDEQGRLGIKQYSATNKTLTPSDYIKADILDYATAQITKVQVRVEENDIGVIVGSGTNAYVIQNNPLLYAESDAQLRPVVANIYNAIRTLTYTPAAVAAFGDPTVRVGGLVKVATGPSTVTTALMSAVWKGNSVTYTSYGAKDLTEVKPTNVQIIALNRKTNVLTRTLDETRSELADAQGQISTISQTVGEIKTTVQNQQGQISTISQTVSGIQTTVSNQAGQISTISQTVSGIQTTVSNQAGQISTISQTVSGIQTTVSNQAGQISTISQTVEGISTRVSGAEGDITTLEQTASGITATVSGLKKA